MEHTPCPESGSDPNFILRTSGLSNCCADELVIALVIVRTLPRNETIRATEKRMKYGSDPNSRS